MNIVSSSAPKTRSISIFTEIPLYTTKAVSMPADSRPRAGSVEAQRLGLRRRSVVMADPAHARITERRPHGAPVEPGDIRRHLLEEGVLAARVGCQALRRIHRHPADRLVASIRQRVLYADRDKREVALDEAMDGAVDLEQQLAAEDVQRLLERMEVATDPAAGLE